MSLYTYKKYQAKQEKFQILMQDTTVHFCTVLDI